MKVALIVLPQPYVAHPMKHQPLGILYLAAAIEQANCEVEVVDLRMTENYLAKLPEANVYGISARTPDYKTAVVLAKRIKEEFGKPVILGGVHGTAVPDEIDSVFNSIILGEGELAILDYLNDLRSGETKRLYQRERIDDLDTIPFPARHLLPYEGIVSEQLIEIGKPATSFITSRGCSFSCSFCAVSVMWGRKVKFHSIQRIVSEIKEVMKAYNIRHLKFQDDTFTLSQKRTLELCKALEPLEIEWMANARVDTVNLEIMQAMKKAGCEWIEFGIESASQKALDILNKRTTIEQAERAVKEAKMAGLKVKELFMIGLPGEGKDISDLDIAFMKKTKPEAAIMATFVPLPGCPIFNNPEKYGIEILTRDYDEYLTNLGLKEGESGKGFIYTHLTMSREEMIWHREKVIGFIDKEIVKVQ